MSKLKNMKRKLSKRETFLLLLLVVTLSIATVFYVFNHSLFFVYNHPETSDVVLNKIYNPIKNMDFILKRTSDYMGNGDYQIKYLYKNYYGSGFLKYNPIPNDLDASVGV